MGRRAKGSSGVGQPGRTGLGPPIGRQPVGSMSVAERFAEAKDLLGWAGQLSLNPPPATDPKMQRIIPRINALGVTVSVTPGKRFVFDSLLMRSTSPIFPGDRVRGVRDGLVFHPNPKSTDLKGAVVLRKALVEPDS